MNHDNTYRTISLIVVALAVFGIAYYLSPLTNTTAPAPESAIPVTDHTVTYTDAGFSPTILATTRGSSITFKNESSKSIRVASNPHPIHDAYPTEGGCVSSTFDSCSDIPSGGSWSFTFAIVGTWGYHNHLNPNRTGAIVVQ